MPPSAAATLRRTILHVEDNDAFADLVEALLADAGFAVHRTRTLADGSDAAQAGAYACAFVDLDLPDADGLQAVMALRAAAAELPIVVLSGDDAQSTPVKSVLLGAQEWLGKHEVSPERLERAAELAVARRDAQAKLLWQAAHDPLTGLPNRACAADHLTRTLARAARDGTCVAVLFCDLDDFKSLNDELGHPAGDKVLCTTAERAVGAVRPGDLVARWGGDELVIVAEPVDARAQAQAIAGRVTEAVAQPIDLGAGTHHPSLTVGIALGTGHDDPHDLVARADHEMLRCKPPRRGASPLPPAAGQSRS